MLKLRTCSEAVRHIAAQAPRTLLLFLDAFDTLLVQPPEHTVAQYEALQNRLWDLGDSGSPGSSSSGSVSECKSVQPRNHLIQRFQHRR